MRACRQASRSAAKAWAVRAMTGVWREPFSRRGFQRALAQREQRLRRLPPGNAAVEALFAFRRDGQDGVEIDQALTEGILRIRTSTHCTRIPARFAASRTTCTASPAGFPLASVLT